MAIPRSATCNSSSRQSSGSDESPIASRPPSRPTIRPCRGEAIISLVATAPARLVAQHAGAWQFWWQHLRWPLLSFCVLAPVFAGTSIDHSIAHALFYRSDPGRWIGSHSVLSNEILHTGGRWLVRGFVAISLAIFAITFAKPATIALRRPATYFATAVVLSVTIVGLFKSASPVHCPWSLAEFGGTQPLTSAGHCFPAAHSSAGFALLAFYFVFRERSAWRARLGLLAGLVAGLTFGIAQQSRGAHFLSHDLWSGFIAWLTCLTLYTFVFRRELWRDSNP